MLFQHYAGLAKIDALMITATPITMPNFDAVIKRIADNGFPI